MRDFYWKVRARITAAGCWPQGWVARGAWYSLALAIFFLLLELLLKLFAPRAGNGLQGWVDFLLFDAAVLFAIVSYRSVKRKILWRLRNRLIVTYIFIGVIPAVLLVVMSSVTIYLFAGQFANFVVTSEINAQLRALQAVNAAVGNELAARIERGQSPAADSLAGLRKRDRAWERRRVGAWHGSRVLLLSDGALNPTPIAYPDFLDRDKNEYAKSIRDGQPFNQIVRDHGELYLRVASVFEVGPEKLTVVTGEPLDRSLLAEIAANLGEISLYAVGIPLGDDSNEKRPAAPSSMDRPPAAPISSGNSTEEKSQSSEKIEFDQSRPTFTVGALPSSTGPFDREITFGTPLSVVDWNTGERARAGALIRVRTRPYVLYSHLFSTLGDIARGIEYGLVAVLIFFAVIELIALIIGTRMTRTMTGAVGELYQATRSIDRGDFSHRIPVKSSDQLAQLSLSFNSMTESIEKLIQEQKEKHRLEGELAIAQEVQAQLFPRQVSDLESLEVHGFCRPARTVSGDYYDFLTASSHKLILAVGDISGKGISAALLMATIHSAVRAYSLESLPQMREPAALGAVAGAGRIMATWPEGVEISPGALLTLLNHQLYQSTPPEKYATLFLGIYDGRSHQLTYSNGGHLPPILISEDGAVRRLEAGGTVVGLFDNMSYDEGQVQMHAGEIFVAYSDGVTEPENEFGEFGEERLIDLVGANRHQPLIQISQAVTSAVDDWIGDNEQPDDITLVLARAR
jgi:sigma-B regulation protein RsbU (phosphoserine phosphatase)